MRYLHLLRTSSSTKAQFVYISTFEIRRISRRILKMVQRFFKGIQDFIVDFVHHPVRVLVVCLTLTFFGLVMDGTLFRLWALYRDSDALKVKIKTLSQNTQDLKIKILKSKDQGFIELQARDRLELAGEGDLIFVFADEEQSSQSIQ